LQDSATKCFGVGGTAGECHNWLIHKFLCR
jgi:hypothetical protein